MAIKKETKINLIKETLAKEFLTLEEKLEDIKYIIDEETSE